MRIFKLNVLIKVGLIISSAAVAVSLAYADIYPDGLSMGNAGKIQDCSNSSVCKNIEPTGDLKKAIDEGYENLAVVDIYGDGNKEIAATSGGGNRCSKFFSYDRATHRFSVLKLSERDICNFKIDGDSLISSYRLDAKQYEDIYKLKNGKYQIAISDACVGCDEIYRSVYVNGRVSEKIIVTNQQNYARRVPITTEVVSNKAMLYENHSDSAATKMYLLKGDKVQLVEFSSEDGLWYLVKYPSQRRGIIRKWVKCEDLAICK
ncbi:hypothetical protein [Burkholderia multivorans]|uniref:hypothetical protein n=1 Tax=Burkholderia multivorans TaxID=87883 RepID=UPI000B1B96DC|nr:hypothetical protein [Burkholderia multivorans]